MNPRYDDKRLDDLISRSIGGQEPRFDLEKWKEKYPQEYQILRERAQADGSEFERRRSTVIGTIFTKRLVRPAAAAAVLVGALGLVVYYAKGPRINGTVWAEVLSQVQAARTVSYKVTYQRQHQPEQAVQVSCAGGELLREQSLTDGQVEIWNYPERKRIVLRGKNQSAEVYKYITRNGDTDELPLDVQRLFGRHLWELFQEDYHYYGEHVGDEEIDGRRCCVFAAGGRGGEIVVGMDPETGEPIPLRKEIKVWVEHSTRLPVRAEIVIKKIRPGGDNFVLAVVFYKYVLSDFVWNEPLAEGLFQTEVPAGYETQEYDIYVCPPNEQTLAEALADCAAMQGGILPDNFNDQAIVRIINDSRALDRPKTLTMEEKIAAYQQIQRIAAAIEFVSRLKASNDWHYAGRGVKMGEADTAICWWKRTESDDYRVIYADLKMGDLSRSELPERVELLNDE